MTLFGFAWRARVVVLEVERELTRRVRDLQAAEERGQGVHCLAINRPILKEAERQGPDVWAEIRLGRLEQVWHGAEMLDAVAIEQLSKKGSTFVAQILAWIFDEAHCIAKDVAYRPLYSVGGHLRHRFPFSPPP